MFIFLTGSSDISIWSHFESAAASNIRFSFSIMRGPGAHRFTQRGDIALNSCTISRIRILVLWRTMDRNLAELIISICLGLSVIEGFFIVSVYSAQDGTNTEKLKLFQYDPVKVSDVFFLLSRIYWKQNKTNTELKVWKVFKLSILCLFYFQWICYIIFMVW